MTRLTNFARIRQTAAPVILLALAAPAMAAGLYERAGWVADIPLGAHQVRAVATIINETTIQVEHFTYDGTAPAVYFYLGESDSDAAFDEGLGLMPLLDRAYAEETLTLFLPDGQTLDGYTAISVWCEEFSVNFSSASFEPPAGGQYERAGLVADIPPGDLYAQGKGTIITDRLILMENFTYDGTAPAVYFQLGENDTWGAYVAGLRIEPILDREYVDETLVLALGDDESLDGYHAISVWCAAFGVNFSSAPFLSACPADVVGDEVVDVLDLLAVLGAWGDAGGSIAEDVNIDGAVDVLDLLVVLSAWGPC